MRGRLLDVLRFTIASPESLAAALGLGASIYFPAFFRAIGRAAANEAGLAVPLCIAVWGLAGYATKLTRDLLSPTETNAKILAKWPDYERLQDRALATILLSGLCASAVGIAMLLRASMPPRRLGLLLIVGIADSLISVWCLFVATLQLRRILDAGAQ